MQNHLRWLPIVCLALGVFVACGDDDVAPSDVMPVEGGADQALGDGGVQEADISVADQGASSDQGLSDGAANASQVLRNAPEVCQPPVLLYGAPEEAGYWAASRLTPASYPFSVEEVRYTLGTSQTSCVVHLAHRMEVYKANTTAPPATPQVLRFSDIPASQPLQQQGLEIKVKFDQPLLLEAGEHLFVQVQLVQDGDKSLCLESCDPPQPITDRDYWSYATAPPFAWKSLASDGMDTVFSVEAEGKVVP